MGRVEHVDGARQRDVSILEVTVARAGGRVGLHAPRRATSITSSCAGASGCRQGEHVVEAGPGDYVRWDGTIPHDAEVIGDDGDAAMLIIRRPADRPGRLTAIRRVGPEPQPRTCRNLGGRRVYFPATEHVSPWTRPVRVPS